MRPLRGEVGLGTLTVALLCALCLTPVLAIGLLLTLTFPDPGVVVGVSLGYAVVVAAVAVTASTHDGAAKRGVLAAVLLAGAVAAGVWLAEGPLFGGFDAGRWRTAVERQQEEAMYTQAVRLQRSRGLLGATPAEVERLLLAPDETVRRGTRWRYRLGMGSGYAERILVVRFRDGRVRRVVLVTEPFD